VGPDQAVVLKKVEVNFILSCSQQPGATVGACNKAYACISGGGSKGVSYKDFLRADLAPRIGQPVDPKVLDKMLACGGV
jgi:hypothetical protein